MEIVKRKGLGGIANIKIKGEKVNVVFEENDKAFQIDKDDYPEYVTNGKFWVSLSGDNKKLISMRPLSGMVSVKFQKFTAKEGEQPSWSVDPQYNYQYANAILEIVGPKYAGMTLFLKFNDFFISQSAKTKDGKTIEVLAIRQSKSKYFQLFVDFLTATLGDEGMKKPIKYSDNPLPVLQKRMLDADLEFQVALKDGWITTIYAEQNEDTDDEDGDEEEVTPAKKSSPVTEKAKTKFTAKVEPDEDEDVESEEEDESEAPWDELSDDEP